MVANTPTQVIFIIEKYIKKIKYKTEWTELYLFWVWNIFYLAET